MSQRQASITPTVTLQYLLTISKKNLFVCKNMLPPEEKLKKMRETDDLYL
jgi:hypothetical protein